MPDDLVAFLRARLDEREARALAANVKQDDPAWFVSPVVASWPRHFTVRSARDRRPIAHVEDLAGDGSADAQGILDGEAVAAHIADNDPAFVLTDVDAKRQLLADHEPEPGVVVWDINGTPVHGVVCAVCGGEELPETWPCRHVRLLALPYAGHPEYDERWRP